MALQQRWRRLARAGASSAPSMLAGPKIKPPKPLLWAKKSLRAVTLARTNGRASRPLQQGPIIGCTGWANRQAGCCCCCCCSGCTLLELLKEHRGTTGTRSPWLLPVMWASVCHKKAAVGVMALQSAALLPWKCIMTKYVGLHKVSATLVEGLRVQRTAGYVTETAHCQVIRSAK